jgi:osmotically-inducible protein OsmY
MDQPNPFAALFQEIAEIAQATLRQSPHFELHEVSCEFSGGVLTLRGRLSSYHLKQFAQAAVAEVPGVVEVHNCVEVATARTTSDVGWKQMGALISVQAG